MFSISRIRGGLVNAQQGVFGRAIAASLPNAYHSPNEVARGTRLHIEISAKCPEDAHIEAANQLESDNIDPSDDIIGECSSYSTTAQNYTETPEKPIASPEATASSTEDTEDTDGAQDDSSGQSYFERAQAAAQRLVDAARENPMLAVATVATGTGVAVVAAPVIITAPIMGMAGMAGFTPAGIAGASVASALQASIGNVAAGSIFATMQSAAAGGYGVAALAGTAQAAGGAVAGAGSIGTAWTWLRGKPKADLEPPKIKAD